MAKAGRMYVKPVMGENLQMDPMKVLVQLRKELNKRLKAKLLETPFSMRAKKALAKSIQIRIGNRSLTITTNHPAFFPLVEGRKRRQMLWLTKAKRPIPIMTDSGELIFRSATPKSMANGKWWHPGREPSNFIDKAKKETRAFVKERLTKEVVRAIKAAIRGD